MVKIIETNLSIGNYDEIIDHQSRVIEVESWDDFVNEIKENITVMRDSFIGNMYGSTVPKKSKLENLQYDDFHLSCDFYNKELKSKKLAYLITQ